VDLLAGSAQQGGQVAEALAVGQVDGDPVEGQGPDVAVAAEDVGRLGGPLQGLQVLAAESGPGGGAEPLVQLDRGPQVAGGLLGTAQGGGEQPGQLPAGPERGQGQRRVGQDQPQLGGQPVQQQPQAVVDRRVSIRW
jgi:hypothetical protein